MYRFDATMNSLARMIATLQIEASMIESHATKLLSLAGGSPDQHSRSELLGLAEEESAKAEMIRHQARLLQGHLDEDTSLAA